MGAFTWSSLRWFQSVEVQVKSWTYFHKSYLRIASDCIDFDLLRGTFFAGGLGGGHARRSPYVSEVFFCCCFSNQFPCLEWQRQGSYQSFFQNYLKFLLNCVYNSWVWRWWQAAEQDQRASERAKCCQRPPQTCRGGCQKGKHIHVYSSDHKESTHRKHVKEVSSVCISFQSSN